MGFHIGDVHKKVEDFLPENYYPTSQDENIQPIDETNIQNNNNEAVEEVKTPPPSEDQLCSLLQNKISTTTIGMSSEINKEEEDRNRQSHIQHSDVLRKEDSSEKDEDNVRSLFDDSDD